MNTLEQVARVHEAWHAMITRQDIEGLMALYTEDATLESSAILVLEGDPSGTLKGKDKLRRHFGAFFDMMKDKPAIELYRPKTYYTDGVNLTWEYPSQSPNGTQLDVVESCDLVDGKIAYQRVYWGWVGFKALWAVGQQKKLTPRVI